jgi:ADP-ribosyl-[dinitrogen reductase] hydrolase
VARALRRFDETGDPLAGSLMRLAPVPLCYARHPRVALEKAALSSHMTHATVTAVDACRYMTGLIVGALDGVSKEELLTPFYTPVPRSW